MKSEAIDTIKVLAANVGAIGMNVIDAKDWIPHLGEIAQNALSIVSLILAISYTAWKWTNDIRKKKSNIKKHNEEKTK